MNPPAAKTEKKIPKEIKRRLTGGLIISLLVHAFILSLQFGLPGLGMPTLEAPWNKRRAETPAITVQIANSAAPANPEHSTPASSVANHEPVPPVQAVTDIKPKPQAEAVAASAAATPVTAASNKSESKAAISGIRLVAPRKAEPVPAPVQAKTSNKPRAAKKFNADATPPVAQKRKVQSPDLTRVITQDIPRDESFTMAVPNPDDLPKKADAEPDPKKQYDDVTQAGVDEESAEEKAAKAQEKEQRRKKREELMRKKADELAQQAAADGKEQMKQVARQIEDDSRKLAEDASRAQAAALALQKQLEAEEQNRRAQREAAAAEELKLAEQKRQDDNKRQEEERQLRAQQLQLALAQAQKDQQQKEQQLREQQAKEQLAKEQQATLEAEKRKQEEQRQQAAVRQKQAEDLLARQKAEEQSARQKADELAARQRAEQVAAEQRAQAQAQAAAAKAAAAQAAANAASAANQAAANNHSANTGSSTGPSTGQQNNAGATTPGNGSTQGNQADPFVLPKNLPGSDLASRAREQARGLDLLRGAPPAQKTDMVERPQRRSLFGSQAKDVPVRLYIESWKQKIERNGNLNYSQISKDRARGDPVVVVLVRSDGSIEDITLLRSSGRADIDEAVRRIVRLNAKYSAFPPNIAAQYDVIEIRHIWNFDDKLRLIEELR